MTNIIKHEIEIEDSLISILNVICDFRIIEQYNLTYVEPY